MKNFSSTLEKSFLLLFLIILTLPAWAQPSNDACSGAITLTLGPECTIGNNLAAGSSGDPAGCTTGSFGAAMDATVWYTFTTTAAGVYTISCNNGNHYLRNNTQLKLFSGTCGSLTNIACNDDCGNGADSTAAQITATLSASTTYYVLVDISGSTEGYFCINVLKNERPANDCIWDATTDNNYYIGDEISDVVAGNLFNCKAYTYNPPGDTGGGDEPTTDKISLTPAWISGANCNGTVLAEAIYQGVWFWFTSTGVSNNPVYISAYPNATPGNFYVMTLLQKTPGTDDCISSTFSGWSYVDCSAGDQAPMLNTTGFARDQAKGSMQNHPRLDISGLSAGTYAICISEYPRIVEDTTDVYVVALARDGIFNLCIEPIGGDNFSDDSCPSANTVGCDDAGVAKNYTSTKTDRSNTGMHGNIYIGNGGNAFSTPVTNEPLQIITTATSGQVQHDCTGAFAAPPASDTKLNNSALYYFTIKDDVPFCLANVALSFENITYSGTNGNGAGFYVIPAALCGSIANGIMSGTTDGGEDCITLKPTIMPAGSYVIVVNGEDGQLVEYDLKLSVAHTSPSGVPCGTACVSVLRTLQVAPPMEIEFHSLKPIPATDRLELSYFASSEGLLSIELIDLTGRTVQKESMIALEGENSQALNIADLSPGMYLLRLQTTDAQVVSRFIKADH